MGIEKEKSHLVAVEAWHPCNGRERRNVGACLFLVGGDNVTGGAPLARKALPVCRVGASRSGNNSDRDEQDMMLRDSESMTKKLRLFAGIVAPVADASYSDMRPD